MANQSNRDGSTPQRRDTGRGGSGAAVTEKNPQATRETVESVVVAIILAFLFRAFIAEAFVIPTGSMAPTLYGRNKDVTCFECDYDYATGASSEVDRGHRSGVPIVATHCPICRTQMPLTPAKTGNHRSFSGDRILVSKFAYAFKQPKRWDVIVFKYPGNAKQNYIKRLIGLPNEAVMIFNGNILTAKRMFAVNGMPEAGREAVRQWFAENGVNLSEDFQIDDVSRSTSKSSLIDDGQHRYAIIHNPLTKRTTVYGDRFEVQRKPPHKLVSMLQIVDDNRYLSRTLKAANWPSRWQDWSGKTAWRKNSDGAFETQGSTGEAVWLRYRHLPPSQDDWKLLNQGGAPSKVGNRLGGLILDYYAYNEGVSEEAAYAQGASHWVGDLAVECHVEVKGNSGALVLELVEGGGRYQCRIDVSSGDATLSIKQGEEGFSDPGDEAVIPTIVGASGVTGPGSYELRFANVDDQLTLWVNNQVVPFKGPTTYQTRPSVLPKWSSSDAGDAEPVGIGSEGGLVVQVDRLRVLRDIYYVATNADRRDEYDSADPYPAVGPSSDLMSDPKSWSQTRLFSQRMPALFGLEADHFFPLGDNSPASSDARMWARGIDEWYVNRQLLIGKAVLIYWPHYWNSPIPFFPNFGRMRLIR